MPDFEQPDLRTKNRGGSFSSYQHPHTGDQVPSVTTISGLIDKSSFLGPWHASLAAQWAAANLPLLIKTFDETKDLDSVIDLIQGGAKRASKYGSDLGSLAHNTIEAICRGEQIDIPQMVVHHVKSWTEFMTRYVKRVIWMEQTVWSHRYRYAGTADVLLEFHDGTTALVDYKTGKEVHADAAMQLVALAKADVLVTTDGEMPMPKIDRLGVLHLPAPVLTPGGRPSVRGSWSYREIPADKQAIAFDTFLHLRAAFEWDKTHAKTSIGGKQTTPDWAS